MSDIKKTQPENDIESQGEFPARTDAASDGRRPLLSLSGSLITNIVFWSILGIVTSRVIAQQAEIEVESKRVVIPPTNLPKPPPQKVIQKSPPKTETHEKVVQKTPQPPAAAPHFLEATGPATTGGTETGPAQGNGPAGVPTDGKGPGTGTGPATPTPPPTPPPAAVEKPTPKPEPPPPPVIKPTPQPAPPKGATRDAEALDETTPQIPDNLRSEPFNSFARVKVEISADGTVTVSLKTSCGNADFDKLALTTVKNWKWRPALKDGDPVDSVQFVRVNLQVD